jgi:DNA repair photolyase
MYELKPPAVYAHESVIADPRYKERIDRVVSSLLKPVEPIIYKDEDLPKLIKEDRILAGRIPMGAMKEVNDPILFFNTFRFDGKRKERGEWLKQQGISVSGHTVAGLLGYGPFAWAPYCLTADPDRNDKVCRPCWRLHFQNGCVHKCKYCSEGGILITMVNIEDYIENLAKLIKEHPWQETYLFEDDADVPGLEPELGCLGPLIEFFGTLKDRYLVIHTKSWNFDWALDLKHNGNTIIVWSISAPTQSSVIEPNTGTTEQRIEAARKCQEAGYTIRYKFKPIIPIRNWRDEASEAIKMIFEKTNPDVISLCVYMWMDINDLKKRVDPSLLDPEYLTAAEGAVEEVANTRAKPFPEWVRAEIYEHHFKEIRKWNSEVPVSLSTENWKMWKRLGDMLDCTATNYVCGCGPNSVPWRKKLEAHPFDIAQKNSQIQYDLM